MQGPAGPSPPRARPHEPHKHGRRHTAPTRHAPAPAHRTAPHTFSDSLRASCSVSSGRRGTLSRGTNGSASLSSSSLSTVEKPLSYSSPEEPEEELPGSVENVLQGATAAACRRTATRARDKQRNITPPQPVPATNCKQWTRTSTRSPSSQLRARALVLPHNHNTMAAPSRPLVTPPSPSPCQ